ncbi:MAG: iron-sulfur cluster assembly scaffold protein [Patescibacteria group bacterium]
MDDIYKENILDHYRNPRNKRQMIGASFHKKEFNAFCGDEVELFASITADGVIREISFTGTGCAISQAAASLLTEQLPGRRAEDIMRMGGREAKELLGIELNAIRVKCALLPLRAFQEGWRIYHDTAQQK